jgi:hypothetical protein
MSHEGERSMEIKWKFEIGLLSSLFSEFAAAVK